VRRLVDSDLSFHASLARIDLAPDIPNDGEHDRLHRDIAEKLENLGQGATPVVLELWREEFSRERAHEALGMR
jgi:hypothetical protein